MSILQDAYDCVKGSIKEKRFIHTLGVVSVAKKLAKINGVDEEKAELAALCHDIAKNISKEDMEKIILQNNVVLTEDEKNTFELWHAILAPVVVKQKLDIKDEEILSAIRWHTTGKEDMTKLEKIIYIADMIEPSRVFDGVEEIREETLKDLDKGVLLGLSHSIKYLLENGNLIDINTVKARNYLISNK
ncbi:MAG: HD domain-containing protein [Clostridium sp.]|nr:HD domain-containing protein [Clostridium sp.]